jgi:hypothetical protein
MSLPLDKDGFLRRQCPSCERAFKWWQTPPDESAEATPAAPEAYFCPYCYEPADPGAWWTEEQLAHAKQLAASEVLGPALRQIGREFGRGSRRSRASSIRFEFSSPSLPHPEPLTEQDDMVRVDVPCHPEEPVKVDEEWVQEVACLVCGIRYPVELVRELPDEESAE